MKDKADKCEQTEDMTDTVSKNVKIAPKQDSILSYPHSSQNSFDGQKDEGNFFGNYYKFNIKNILNSNLFS